MSKAKFAFGALIGAVAGVIAGVLTAPKSGKETRADLKVKATELKGVTAKHAEELKERSKSVAEEVKEKADSYKKRGEQAIEGAVEGAKKGFYNDK